MDNRQIWITAFIALIVAIVVSLVTGVVSPALAPRTSLSSAPINANSCNADGICEVNNIKTNGQLTLARNGDTQGVLIYSEEDRLYFNPDALNTKLQGNFDIVNDQGDGKTTLTTNNLGSLVITPTSGATKINADLTLSGEGYQGGVIVKSNNLGSFIVTPSSGFAKFEGTLSTSTLAGDSIAYVCTNSNGELFRSQTPCV